MGRPPIGKVAMTAAERVQRYRLKHGLIKPPWQPGPDMVKAQARISELTQRLKEASAQITQLKGALAKPKAKKPPLPPDEERERTIKSLRTQVQKMKATLAAVAGRASMPRATLNAIAKALHPDRKLSEAEREAERETALKLFTAWKAEKDWAARIAKGNL